MAEPVGRTLPQIEDLLKQTIRAQSFILAAVLRPLIGSGYLDEGDLAASLDATEVAALERGTLETPAIVGLVQMLRQDLGLPEATGQVD